VSKQQKELLARFAVWRADPAAWVGDVLINPETGKPFVLYAEEIEFLRRGFTLTKDGRLPFPELLFSAPKKSGKTAFAAMAALYLSVVLGGPYSEIYCLSNDLDQSIGRVFTAIARIVRASPLLARTAKIEVSKITFTSTGSVIVAVANDYRGQAGSNPSLSIFDELWGYTSERSRRLWDEMVPPPTRKVAARLTVSYAGFESESELLEGLYKRSLTGKTIARDMRATSDGLLCYWTHELRAPWQSQQWETQMLASLRTNQFRRMIRNEWVSTESSFIEMTAWDACVDAEIRPIVAQPRLSVYVGCDASTKHDSTAICVCAYDKSTKRVRLVKHFVFQPTKENPLDFEATIEATLLELCRAFYVRQVFYDPWQLVALAQRLQKARVPMVEFPQSVGNLTEASSNLYDLIQGRNLTVYPDPALRLAISRAVAVESGRGWRITKEKASHKIDVVVALAQAALGAAKQEGRSKTTIRPLFGSSSPLAAWRARGEARLRDERERPLSGVHVESVNTAPLSKILAQNIEDGEIRGVRRSRGVGISRR
jgi:phage terminase large subunit-like protein